MQISTFDEMFARIIARDEDRIAAAERQVIEVAKVWAEAGGYFSSNIRLHVELRAAVDELLRAEGGK